MAEAICPSCRVTLARPPKRRAKCIHCGQPILVRKGRLCTEEEARAIDVCNATGIPLQRLWATRQLLTQDWGRGASAGDAAWRLLNELGVTTPDHHSRGMIYFQMARYLWEDGRDHLAMARESRKMELLNWEKAVRNGLLHDSVRVVVITCGEMSCPACQTLAGREFTLKLALAQSPIPVPDPTRCAPVASEAGVAVSTASADE